MYQCVNAGLWIYESRTYTRIVKHCFLTCIELGKLSPKVLLFLAYLGISSFCLRKARNTLDTVLDV